MMKKAAIIVLSSLSFMLPSAAQEPVPYAYRPSRQGEGYIPTLAAIMREIQFCHIKLSYAGQQSNWELANYEVAQIENNLSNALQLYQNIPIVKIKLIDQPLVDLSQAVNAKDKVRFVRAFTDMTNACNSCHEAANVSFISIQVPTSSPFSDQSFAPKKERSHPN
jgi:hypothetical protein